MKQLIPGKEKAMLESFVFHLSAYLLIFILAQALGLVWKRH